MSNFRFLAEEWPSIAQEVMEAERSAKSASVVNEGCVGTSKGGPG